MLVDWPIAFLHLSLGCGTIDFQIAYLPHKFWFYMRFSFTIALLVSLLGIAAAGQAQSGIYRFVSLTNGNGSTFFALDGSTGKLYFMNDFGESPETWRSYGEPLREIGRNNLSFDAVPFEKGSVFYALEMGTGQLYYMPDFGANAGRWETYGEPIRLEGMEVLSLAAERSDNGTKFTAMDGNTGQVYYMFDFGDHAGHWARYGGPIE
jgi:outer membrane protein assembly factor BamB